KRALLMTVMKQMMKPVVDAYEKHGVTEKHLKKTGGMMSLIFTGGDAEKLKKALADAAKPVKQRTAFIDDLLTAMKKVEKMSGKGGGASWTLAPTSRLTACRTPPADLSYLAPQRVTPPPLRGGPRRRRPKPIIDRQGPAPPRLPRPSGFTRNSPRYHRGAHAL